MDDFRPTSSTAHHHPHPEELLSPLEQEVLDEYGKLVGNLDDVFLSLFFSFSFSFPPFSSTYPLTYLPTLLVSPDRLVLFLFFFCTFFSLSLTAKYYYDETLVGCSPQ